MDKAGVLAAVVVAVIWILIGLDINVWRHLTGAAVVVDVLVGVLLTLGILGHLPPPRREE